MKAVTALCVALVGASLWLWGWKIARPRLLKRLQKRRYGDLDGIVSFSGRLVAGKTGFACTTLSPHPLERPNVCMCWYCCTAGRALENEEAEPLVRDDLAPVLAGPLAMDRARQRTQARKLFFFNGDERCLVETDMKELICTDRLTLMMHNRLHQPVPVESSR